MPRISKCDKLTEHDRLRLVGRIGEGVSWERLEGEFGIPRSSIAEWATRNGYGRSPVEAKRKAVDKLLAQPETGGDTGGKPETGNAETDAAAERDARVARLAANVAATCIKRLAETIGQTDTDPKTVKLVSEALAKAWDTYARINKLDDVGSADIVIKNPRSFDAD